MLSNITSSSPLHPGDRQSLFTPGGRVYLYSDTEYIGTLLRPVERTYPDLRVPLRLTAARGRSPKYSVALDQGGYEAVNVKQISLADIWDLLSVDEFVLSEIFAEDKLIAVELIRPPKRRKKPEPCDKQTFPLMRPEDVMRNRTMFRVLSG